MLLHNCSVIVHIGE